MNDKEIEKIQTLDVNVSAESMDAHVLCLRENGYKVITKNSIWTRYLLCFLLGSSVMGHIYG